MQQSGSTAIHVTHDQDEAMSVADEILVLRNGRIQDFGLPRRVYRRPASVFVANMIGGASLLEGIVDTTVGETALISVRGGLTVQAPSKNLTLTVPVILALRKERVRIARDRLEMENVFKGEIRGVRFLGNSNEYLVRIPNGDVLTSRLFAEARGRGVQGGGRSVSRFPRGGCYGLRVPTAGFGERVGDSLRCQNWT